jgi:hypothetical protein
MIVAWQRQIRDRKALSAANENLFGAWWEDIDVDLDKAVINPVSYETAQSLIREYEWLGNMGTTEFAYGLYWEGNLGGAVCFGRTAGTGVYASVAGADYASRAITLCRGACAHWAHPHAASYLINRACRLMYAAHGYQIFLAYSDPSAGEIGTVYQASGWMYCGMTSPTEKFKTPDGKVRDGRLVSAYTRDRRGGVLRYKRTRAEQKQIMQSCGIEFFQGNSKHRYALVVGSRKEKKALLGKWLWPNLEYPKRECPVSDSYIAGGQHEKTKGPTRTPATKDYQQGTGSDR